MATTDKQKQSLYFPDEVLREIKGESIRQDRSLSWIVQQAWRLARAEVRKLPAPEQRAPEQERTRGAGDDPDAPRGRPSPELLEFLKGKFDRDLTI
jgi:uncharacterized small protein (TIGR04563 family)